MTGSNIDVQWVTEESGANALSDAARKEGGIVSEIKNWMPGPKELDDYGDAMFEPLTAVALIVAAGWLIRRMADVLSDFTRPGGQLIDARVKPVVVRPLPKTKPPGKLVILTAEGTKVFPPERRDEGLAFLNTVLQHINA